RSRVAPFAVLCPLTFLRSISLGGYTMKLKTLVAGLIGSVAFAASAYAADLKFMQGQVERFMAANPGDKVTIVPMPSSTSDQFGQYRLWLAAGNSDIDVYTTDVIWAPQLAD